MAENGNVSNTETTTEETSPETQEEMQGISIDRLVATASRVTNLLHAATRGPSEAIPVLIAALANVDVAGRGIDMKGLSPEDLFAKLPREEMITDMQEELRRIYEYLIPTPEELAKEKQEREKRNAEKLEKAAG